MLHKAFQCWTKMFRCCTRWQGVQMLHRTFRCCKGRLNATQSVPMIDKMFRCCTKRSDAAQQRSDAVQNVPMLHKNVPLLHKTFNCYMTFRCCTEHYDATKSVPLLRNTYQIYSNIAWTITMMWTKLEQVVVNDAVEMTSLTSIPPWSHDNILIVAAQHVIHDITSNEFIWNTITDVTMSVNPASRFTLKQQVLNTCGFFIKCFSTTFFNSISASWYQKCH